MFFHLFRSNCNCASPIGVSLTMKRISDCIHVWRTARPMNFIVVINCIETVLLKNPFKLVIKLYKWLTFSTPFSALMFNIWIFLGFHLSATVVGTQPRAQFNVAVTFDRRRISSCNCTCSSAAYWCSHVVAVCLHRIHCVSGKILKLIHLINLLLKWNNLTSIVLCVNY